MLRNLSTSLLEHERITTTLSKAKVLRRYAEKLVTLSKKESLHARRLALRKIRSREVVAKLFDTLSARYSQRPGGYTRIIKIGPRRGDQAEMAIIELVGSELTASAPETRVDEAATKKSTRKSADKTPKKAPAKKPTADGGRGAAAAKSKAKGGTRSKATSKKTSAGKKTG